ncbi:MAG: GyrI-like domain-containing protein [Dermatophilaceae bacterium]
MAMKSTGDPSIDALYKVGKGKVEFVDVPELGFVAIDGGGAPGDDAFSNALQALYSVSYTAHFAVKKAMGEAPRVMALEALWWVYGTDAQATMERIALGGASMEESDRDQWRWRAMIIQLPPIDEAVIVQAISEAKAKKDNPALDAVRYERWAEGPSAQIMHVGPYSTEQVSIVELHHAIASHGSRPRGRHHEIYLGDPRTSAPEKLRTILRQPIEPAR